ncbi:MAG: DUF3368 domain-containing protein [Desulfobulbus sp.]|nr:DUF3368 domain-containing protein [Desulfobulbus sp.]
MNQRVVIADAGPLIALARVDALDLLRRLFGRVCLTATVRDEILPGAARFPDADALVCALRESWLDVVEPPSNDWQPLNPGVDAGEASAIHTVCHWRDQGINALLLMDDRAGRLEAKSHGIALIGTAAIIGLAKTAGLIPAAQPLLERLAQSGYYLGQAVIAAVMAETGE